jgi:hypothetical protein
VAAVGLLLYWARTDRREAERTDRALDRAEQAGHDNALEEYNRMLATLADADRQHADVNPPRRPAER